MAPTVGTNSGSASAVPSGALESPLSGQEGAEFRDIQRLYSQGAYEALLQKLNSFEKRFPRSAQIAQAQNLHGLALLLTKKPSDAIIQFRKAMASGASNALFVQYVLYNLASAQLDAGQYEDAGRTLEEITPENLDKDNRLKFSYLHGRVALKRGRSDEAAREILNTSRWPMDDSMRASFRSLLDVSLQEVKTVSTLEELYRSHDDSPLADSLLLRLGTQEMVRENPGKAEGYLKTLVTKFPQSPYFGQASDLIHATQSRMIVDATAVGVLLPMKGKFGRFGTRSLQAIEMAFRIFNAAEPATRYTLVVEDSGEEVDQTIRALDRLVLKHHVAAIIGPLLAKGIDQVTQRAQELGVPMVSLSRYYGASANPTPSVFQAGLTMKLQAREVARYAIEKMGLKRFAILSPRDKTGEEVSQQFWDAVESMGGTIVGYESYNPGETDFRQPIDKLSGLFYQESRQRELDALAKDRETNNIKKRTRKTEQFFALKPIVDYEAVFIPDEPRVAGLILPTFAYRDVDKIKFLGTSAWNSPDFLSRAGATAESATFVDAFYQETRSTETRRFIDKYRSIYGQEPGSMEAVAFDAAKLVETSLEQVRATDGTSRGELRDRLQGVRSFPGVTGRISYQDGQFNRELKVLSVKGGHIVEISTN